VLIQLSVVTVALAGLLLTHLLVGGVQLRRRHDLDVRPLLWGLTAATALLGLSVLSLAQGVAHQAHLDTMREAKQVLLSAGIWTPYPDRIATLFVLGGQLLVNGVVGLAAPGRKA